MKKRHVIFDFDGTITDSFGPCSKDLMETAKKMGLPADKKVLSLMAENYGLPTTELLNICWPNRAHEAFEQSIVDGNAKSHTPLFPGAENMLMTLEKAGIGMSIFTGRQRSGVFPVLKDFGIDKFFSQVVTREDVVVGKPNPEGLMKIIDPLIKHGFKKVRNCFCRRQPCRL
jgi:phosphoglycolate phosphatase-like HAD superfamily hydrolase